MKLFTNSQIYVKIKVIQWLQTFFIGSLQEWLRENLNGSMGACGKDEWGAIFMIACYMLWYWPLGEPDSV